MCQVLRQIYVCGHSKSICITPCPTALASSVRDRRSLHRHTSATATNHAKSYGHIPSYDARIRYCNAIFLHKPPGSQVPCLRCFIKPKYTALQKRWVDEYRSTHQGTKSEELGYWSGVTLIPERLGLVNVVEISRALEKLGLEEKDGTEVGKEAVEGAAASATEGSGGESGRV